MLQRSIDALPAMLQRNIRTRVLLAVSAAQRLWTCSFSQKRTILGRVAKSVAVRGSGVFR